MEEPITMGIHLRTVIVNVGSNGVSISSTNPMSANNILRIREYDHDPQYRLSDECIEVPPEKDSYFASANTLEEAIHIANDYMQEEIVEYGLSIHLLNGRRGNKDNITNI